MLARIEAAVVACIDSGPGRVADTGGTESEHVD